MRASFPNLRAEFRPMFMLAAPVVVAELGWIAMGMVDTLMVGRLSAEAIGAVAVGSAVFHGVAVFALGMLLGLDTLVSQAFGARRVDECHQWLVQGIVLSVALAVPVTAMLLLVAGWFELWQMDPGVLRLARPYLQIVTWSVLPLLLYFCFRRYLQGVGLVRPVMFALLLANGANVVVNWILIFGKLGAPALGVAGAAWATVISRVVMCGVLAFAILLGERERRPGLFATRLRVDLTAMRRLVVLGVPAALQLTLEVGVFAAASALAARLTPDALAAHQIALNLAGFTFMVPLGIASAGAVRVGHAIGASDAAAAARAGWTALLFGGVFMSVAAVAFLTVPHALIGAFTSHPGVIQTGVALLSVAAVFQLFDGLQGVGTGILRGLGDTRTPMLWNLGAHWGLGLPVGYTLAFSAGLGVIGLWWGLSLGLIICGVALVILWWRRIHAVLRLLPALGGGPMPVQNDPPRPHGDPLEGEVVKPAAGQGQGNRSDTSLHERHELSGPDESAGRETSGAAAEGEEADASRRGYGDNAEVAGKID